MDTFYLGLAIFMSDDEEGRRLDSLRTVRTSHTGTQFESGEVYERRGRNEPAPGVDAVDGREQQSEWSGGHSNYSNEAGRRRKLADTPDTKVIQVPGKGAVTVIKGSNAVEDERWIYITEVKANGSKVYLCLACKGGYSFTGSEARVISHKLQLGDGTVKNCTALPSAECRVVLERIKAEKDKRRCAAHLALHASRCTPCAAN